MDRFQELKNSCLVENLRIREKAQPEPSVRYIKDLSLSINSCKTQIRQLTFARKYPLVMVNGAS